jgi:hypothetical protein
LLIYIYLRNRLEELQGYPIIIPKKVYTTRLQ